MAFLAKKSSIKTIYPSDRKFMITDGLIRSPRAGFEISIHCPEGYAAAIRDSIDQGWLKPVAYVKEDEFMWDILNED